jgi:NADPH2:quinone reductase
MPFPRVIPHSDGAGVIDAVGARVSAERLGQKVWCYGAQSCRPFGTAAEYCVVPSGLAVPLPAAADADALDQAACLGIAGITGYRALFAAGSVRGLTALVYGAAGGVGSIATQMAVRDGAQVIGVVRRPAQQDMVRAFGAHEVFLADEPDLATQIRKVAPEGVHRIAEIDFAGHIYLNAAIIAIGATISSYYSRQGQPSLPDWPLGFADTTLRLLGSDDFAPAVKAQAASELTSALVDGALRIPIAERLPLDGIAIAHEHIELGTRGRVLLHV